MISTYLNYLPSQLVMFSWAVGFVPQSHACPASLASGQKEQAKSPATWPTKRGTPRPHGIFDGESESTYMYICIWLYYIYIYTYYTFITNLGCFHISLLVRVEIRWGVVGLWLAKKESKFNQEWSTPKIAWIHNTFIRALYNLWIRNPTWFFPTPRTTWPNLNKKKTGKLGRTHSQTNTNRASIKDFALSGMNDVETLW